MELSCSTAYGIFPDQGSNPCLLHWQVDFLPLSQQGSPCILAFFLEEVRVSNLMAAHSSTIAWKIPWKEEPGRLQSMGSLRVRHDWATSLSLFTFLHWRRKWQPTPVFTCLENPRDGEPDGLPSKGSHRVGHDWSDLAVAESVSFGGTGEEFIDYQADIFKTNSSSLRTFFKALKHDEQKDEPLALYFPVRLNASLASLMSLVILFALCVFVFLSKKLEVL